MQHPFDVAPYGFDLRQFRPGHADYTYFKKYGIRDYRGGGRSSARETTMRVAAGAIARKWLKLELGIEIQGWLAQLGPIRCDEVREWDTVDDNPFFCPDPSRVPELEAYMDALRKSGDSVGARVNVVARNVPAGLGAPVYGKLDAELVHGDPAIGFLNLTGFANDEVDAIAEQLQTEADEATSAQLISDLQVLIADQQRLVDQVGVEVGRAVLGVPVVEAGTGIEGVGQQDGVDRVVLDRQLVQVGNRAGLAGVGLADQQAALGEIGRASCRERV